MDQSTNAVHENPVPPHEYEWVHSSRHNSIGERFRTCFDFLFVADADQLDLYYLVDCVLDEIEAAKALKRQSLPDGCESVADGFSFADGDQDLIMPEANLEDRTVRSS